MKVGHPLAYHSRKHCREALCPPFCYIFLETETCVGHAVMADKCQSSHQGVQTICIWAAMGLAESCMCAVHLCQLSRRSGSVRPPSMTMAHEQNRGEYLL